MLAAKSRAKEAFLVGIVDGIGGSEEVLQRHPQPAEHFKHEKPTGCMFQDSDVRVDESVHILTAILYHLGLFSVAQTQTLLENVSVCCRLFRRIFTNGRENLAALGLDLLRHLVGRQLAAR